MQQRIGVRCSNHDVEEHDSSPSPHGEPPYKNLHYLETKVQIMKTIKLFAHSSKSVTQSLCVSAIALFAAAPMLGCSSAQTQPTTVAQGASCGAEGDQLLAEIYSPGGIYDAKPIEKRIFKARANQPIRTMGASLYVKATPEMNSPYLRRVLECHAASPAVAHANDPLHPSNGQIASLDVREAKHGFAVEIMANDPKVGAEIWKRAESLAKPQGSVEIKQISSTKLDSTQTL